MGTNNYNFIYDDGNGPSYAYYPNGKLFTKTTARGIVSTNTYTIFGQLATTTYSDGTPTVTKQYNRLGQPILITDAQGTRTFTYNTNTFALLSESINGTNTMSYSYNDRGIQTGTTINDKRITINEFDDYGRPATLHSIFGSETNTFHYNYLYGSATVLSRRLSSRSTEA